MTKNTFIKKNELKNKTSESGDHQIEAQKQLNNETLVKENKELQQLVTKLRNDLEISQKSRSDEPSIEFEKQKLENELENVKREQEDLLVLLTDQDSKLRHYKKRLKELNQTVSSHILVINCVYI